MRASDGSFEPPVPEAPRPRRGRVSVAPSLLNCSDADAIPTDDAVNVRFTVVDSPALRLPGRLDELVILNFDASLPEIESTSEPKWMEEEPTLVRVSFCVVLDPPPVMSLKTTISPLACNGPA